jgi:hypothetical protein
MATFDLGIPDTKAAAERGIEVPIMDPANPAEQLKNAVGEPLSITILGGDSEKVRRRDRQSLNRVIENIRKKKDQGGAEETEQEQVARLATATLAWTFKTPDGKPVDCTEQNAKAIYGDPRYPYLVEQLQQQIDNRAALFQTRSDS